MPTLRPLCALFSAFSLLFSGSGPAFAQLAKVSVRVPPAASVSGLGMAGAGLAGQTASPRSNAPSLTAGLGSVLPQAPSRTAVGADNGDIRFPAIKGAPMLAPEAAPAASARGPVAGLGSAPRAARGMAGSSRLPSAAPGRTRPAGPVADVAGIKKVIGETQSRLTSKRSPQGIPAKLVIGPASFSVGDLGDLIGSGLFERIKKIKDPVKRRELIAAHSPIEEFDIRWVMEMLDKEDPDGWQNQKTEAGRKKGYAEFMKKYEAFKEKLPGIIKAHFEEMLKAYPHSVTDNGEYAVYEVPRGLEFWNALAESPDPDKSLAGKILLRAFASREERDLPVRMLQTLNTALEHKTQVIDAAKMSPAELAIVRDAAQKHGRKVSRHWNYILVGGGNSFHLAHQILSAAERLENPALARRFTRVLRFFAAKGIPIKYDENQGAAAYYNPSSDIMAFVMPSRADLNTTAHEGNHARFQRFQKHLKRWARKRGLAVPYSVDGPQYALFGTIFGGFMNLLNELRSWRIGESFEGGKTDEDILGVLRKAYGRQAGYENVRIFSRIWTAARVAGEAVPWLIRKEFQRLNALTDEQVTALGDAALAENDRVKSHDFMRLANVRYPKLEDMPEDWVERLERLTRSPHDGVAWVARNLLGRPQPEPEEKAEEEFPENPTRAQLKALFQDAMTEDTDKTKGRQQKAMSRLETLFDDVYKLETLYTERALERMNRIDGPDAEPTKNRPMDLKHIAFSKSIDRALASGMFDGHPSVHRLALANLIRTRTYPQELPRLHAKLKKILTSNDPDKNDLWLARMFLVPGTEFFSAHLRWGESMARAIRKDKTPSVDALEFLGEYYRLALGRALPGPRWGKFNHRMDKALADKARKGLVKMTGAERIMYSDARWHMWKLLAHPDVKVRTSVRYALAGYPGYLLGLQPKILRTLRAKDSRYRAEALRLAAMMSPGFLPKVDRALKHMKLTPEEKKLLEVRMPAAKQDIWGGGGKIAAMFAPVRSGLNGAAPQKKSGEADPEETIEDGWVPVQREELDFAKDGVDSEGRVETKDEELVFDEESYDPEGRELVKPEVYKIDHQGKARQTKEGLEEYYQAKRDALRAVDGVWKVELKTEKGRTFIEIFIDSRGDPGRAERILARLITGFPELRKLAVTFNLGTFSY